MCYARFITLKLIESCSWFLLHFVSETLSATEFPLAFNDFLHVEQSVHVHCHRNVKGAEKFCFLSSLGIRMLHTTVKDMRQQEFVRFWLPLSEKKNLVIWRCPDGFIKIKVTGCGFPPIMKNNSTSVYHNIQPALPMGHVPQQRVPNVLERRWVGLCEFSRSSGLWLKEGNSAVE